MFSKRDGTEGEVSFSYIFWEERGRDPLEEEILPFLAFLFEGVFTQLAFLGQGGAWMRRELVRQNWLRSLHNDLGIFFLFLFFGLLVCTCFNGLLWLLPQPLRSGMCI